MTYPFSLLSSFTLVIPTSIITTSSLTIFSLVSRKLIKSGLNNDFSHGSIVEILALADDGWTFVEWKGDVSSSMYEYLNV
jgi:hypothetical protein